MSEPVTATILSPTTTTNTGNATFTLVPASPMFTAPATPAPAAVAAPAAATPAAAPETTKPSLEDSLAGLDESVRTSVLEEVRALRREAAGYRDRAKTAADEVRAEITEQIAKAMGVGVAATPADPAELAVQLAGQTAAARLASVELAVFRAAATNGGDANALLDSVSFVRSLADVDPSDGDAIGAKVRAAVTANPTLSLAPVRRAPGPNPAMGSSSGGAPDVESEIAAAMKAGDISRVIHLQNTKLTATPR